jgi:hypothetical protein
MRRRTSFEIAVDGRASGGSKFLARRASKCAMGIALNLKDDLMRMPRSARSWSYS